MNVPIDSTPPHATEFPRKIQIQTHGRCNFACRMCPYPEQPDETVRAKLDMAVFESVLRQVDASGTHVKLCLMLQNEPLLDPRFLDFLRAALSAGPCIESVSTVTNGSTLSHDLLDQLLTDERLKLTVSVNAIDREGYRAVHRRDRWERLRTLLETWQGPKHRVRLSYVVGRDCLEEGRAFGAFWASRGYSMRYVPLNARAGALKGDGFFDTIDREFGHCHYPVDTLTVLANGSVILCCNDWKHAKTYGSLCTESIISIWNQSDLRSVRQDAIAGRIREHSLCRGCDYPTRSSVRVDLEARLSGSTPAVAGASWLGANPIVPHLTTMRWAGANGVPALVIGIERDTKTVWVVVKDRPDVPAVVEFELRIGAAGALDFGSLAPVWVKAAVDFIDDGGCLDEAARDDVSDELEDRSLARLSLNMSAEALGFFAWYANDWTPV